MYLQRWHGWCHMKLLPSRRKSCVHHTTMLHVTSCKATYVRGIHVWAVTCHLHFWQNVWDLLRATVVTRGGGMDTEIRVSTESWPWRRKFSRRSCRDSNLHVPRGVYLNIFPMVVLWAMWHTFVPCCTYDIHVFSVVVLYFTWYFYVPCGIRMLPLVVLCSPWYFYVPCSIQMFPLAVLCSLW